MSQNTDSQTSGGDVAVNHYPWLDGFQRQLRALSLNLDNKDYYRLVKKFESLVSVEATKLRHKPNRATKFVPTIKRLIGNLKLMAVSMEWSRRSEDRISPWFGLCLTHYINIIHASSMKNSRSTEAIASDLYVFVKQILEGCEEYVLDTILCSNVIQDTADRNTTGYFVLWKIIQERRIYTSENEPFLKFLTILKLFQECEGNDGIVNKTILAIKGFPPGFRHFAQQKLNVKITPSDDLDLVYIMKKIKTVKMIKLSKERLSYYTSRDRGDDDGSETDDSSVLTELKVSEEFFIDTKGQQGQGPSWLLNEEDDLNPIEDTDILLSEAEDETNESVEEKYVPPSRDLSEGLFGRQQVNGDRGNREHDQAEVKNEENENDETGDVEPVTYSQNDDQGNSEEEVEEVVEVDDEDMEVDLEDEDEEDSESESESETENEEKGPGEEETSISTQVKEALKDFKPDVDVDDEEDGTDSGSDSQSSHGDGDDDGDKKQKAKTPPPKFTPVVEEESDSEIEAIFTGPPASHPDDSESDERDEASSDSDADHFCSPGSTQSESESENDLVIDDKVENETQLDKERSPEAGVELPLPEDKISERAEAEKHMDDEDEDMDDIVEIEMISPVKSGQIKSSPRKSRTAVSEDEDEIIEDQLTPSPGKSVEKELTPSPRKGVDKELTPSPGKSVEKELTPSRRKSVEKDLTPSPRKGVDKESTPTPVKSVEKDLTASPHKSVEKELTPSPRKSVEKDLTPSPRKIVEKEVTPSPRKSVEKESTPTPRKIVEKESTPTPRKGVGMKMTPGENNDDPTPAQSPPTVGRRLRRRSSSNSSSLTEVSVVVHRLRSASSSISGDSQSQSQTSDLESSQGQSSPKAKIRAPRGGKRAVTETVSTIKEVDEDEATSPSPKRGVATRANRSRATVVTSEAEVPVARGRGRPKTSPEADTTRGRGRGGRGRGRGRGSPSPAPESPKRTLRERRVPPKK